MQEQFRSGDPYTGRMYEEDFIGAVRIDTAAYREALAAASRTDGYVPFERAAALARAFQPWDPTNPAKDFSRDIRIEVLDMLGWGDAEQTTLDRVKVYTAVKTPLDILHGVDGFLEVEDPDTRTLHRVTFDLSRRRKDASELKADLLIHDLPEPEEDAYLHAVRSHAQRVVALLHTAKPLPMPSKQPPPPGRSRRDAA